MKTEQIEALSIAIAKLRDDEERLKVDLERVRAKKAEAIARITEIARNVESAESRPVDSAVRFLSSVGSNLANLSKRQRVRDYIERAGVGNIVAISDIARTLDIDANMVSTYIGQFKGFGWLEPVDRGRYRVTERTPPM